MRSLTCRFPHQNLLRISLSSSPHTCHTTRASDSFSMMKPTWCTSHSIYWESRASSCFEHYLFILRSRCTNGIGILRAYSVSWLWHQLALYTRNIQSAVCVAPPEDEQAMLETCRGSWFLINWIKSASRWFYYTDLSRC
jgi:hypothetical protein